MIPPISEVSFELQIQPTKSTTAVGYWISLKRSAASFVDMYGCMYVHVALLQICSSTLEGNHGRYTLTMV